MTLKRRLLLIVALCGFATAPVLADYSAGQIYWTRVSNHWNGTGGEFTLYYNGPAVLSNSAYADVVKGQDGRTNSFQSFCLEMREYVQNPMDAFVSETFINETTGAVTGEGSHAIYGGKTFGDNLDSRTAYLYTRFAAGALSNYAYTGVDRAASAGALQKVIWYLEQEIGNLTDSSGGFVLDAAQQAQADAWIAEAESAIASGRWSGIGQVRVLNMWGVDADGNYVKLAQDQLYVPVPAAALLGLLGLGAAGIKLRRFA
jgi:hypothetical protein